MNAKDLRAKYKRRRVGVAMVNREMTWPPKEEYRQRTPGVTRIFGPDEGAAMPEFTRSTGKQSFWKNRLDKHRTLVKQVEHDEWQR